MTQETGTLKKPTVPDESSDGDNGQGEYQTSCRRISRIDEQSKTETAKNRVLGSKKIKLEPAHNADARTVLQKLKAKIVLLHNIRLNQLLINNNTAERIEGEQATMYTNAKEEKRENHYGPARPGWYYPDDI